MPEWLVWQRSLYWGCFAAGFLLTGLWETYRPRRRLRASTPLRWALHLFLASLSNALLLLFPAGAALLAVQFQHAGWGVLNQLTLPLPLNCLLSLAALDFLRWAQHFAFHRIPFLWRFHRVHHADPDFDFTTALRFHPIETILTLATYLGAVFVLGPQPVVVMAHELAILAQGFFAHANASLPPEVERTLRTFLVTPDLHRIHHSADTGEQQHNFGSLFPWWDRALHTFQAEPAAGHAAMRIGLPDCDPATATSFLRILAMPFRRY